jgi:hypothetical protein
MASIGFSFILLPHEATLIVDCLALRLAKGVRDPWKSKCGVL